METFAKSLPGLVGRQVVDKTDLTGGLLISSLSGNQDRELDRDVPGEGKLLWADIKPDHPLLVRFKSNWG